MRFASMRLADRVVDLVRTGVREIFTLQINLRAPALGDARHEGERRRPTHERLQLMRDGRLEVRAVQMLAHAGFEPLERGDQRLRHIAAAERAEAAAGVGEFSGQLVGEQVPGIDLEGLEQSRGHLLRARWRGLAACEGGTGPLPRSSRSWSGSSRRGFVRRRSTRPHRTAAPRRWQRRRSLAKGRRRESVPARRATWRALFQSDGDAGAADGAFEQHARRQRRRLGAARAQDGEHASARAASAAI